jgi:CelD/BcsL family acetyltransferase involved in cellulose biosynthesis
MLELSTLRTPEELASVARSWDGMVRAMPRPSPFLLHDWIAAWERHFGDGRSLEVTVARRDGEVVGGLALSVSSVAGVKVAAFPGAHNSALADVIVAPGEDDETARAIVEAASRGSQSAIDVFGLPADSRLEAALGGRMTTIQRVESPVMEAPDGWEAAYQSKTSSKTRNQHKRRRKQLAALGEYSVETARTREELEAVMDDVFRLHVARWAGRPDGTELGTAQGQAFAREATLALAEADIPRIVFLRIGGEPVAFFYYMALEGTMYLYRLAFDPEYAKYSPGLVNALDALEIACDEGLTRIEFLGGGERYKMQLADRVEPLYQGLAVSRGLPGRAYVTARRAGIEVRKRAKRSERLRKIYFESLAPVRRRLSRGAGGDDAGA